jgi:hypothetical protein
VLSDEGENGDGNLDGGFGRNVRAEGTFDAIEQREITTAGDAKAVSDVAEAGRLRDWTDRPAWGRLDHLDSILSG